MPAARARCRFLRISLLVLLLPAAHAQNAPGGTTATAVAPPATVAPSFAVELRDDLEWSTTAGRDRKRRLLDLYLPQGPRNPPLVLLVHGGTWSGGDKIFLRFVGEALAQHGYACAITNYRLFPIARHPDFVQDVATAFAWLHAHAAEQGFDRDRMFVMGHSAGAHLVALVAFDPDWLRQAGAPAGAVKGCLAMSPPCDLRPPHFLLNGIFGRDPAVRAKASPIVHVRQGGVPTLLVWGQREMERIDESCRLMAAQMQEVGHPCAAIEFPNDDHQSYLFRVGRERDVLLPPVLAFLERRCAELAQAPRSAAPQDR